MTRLALDAGRRRGVRPGDIVKVITTSAGIPGSAIGDIDVQDELAFIEIKAAAANKVLKHLQTLRLGSIDAKLSLARPRTTKRG
jgi:hypothetical protein